MIISFLAIISFGYFKFFNFAKTEGDKVSIRIKSGSSIRKIGDLLESKNIVKNAFMFGIIAKLENKTNILAGNYALKEGLSYDEAISMLKKGPIIKTYKITIPEGFLINQIAKKVEENSNIKSSEFKEALKKGFNDYAERYKFLRDTKIQSLEGYLFPKTYEIFENTKADQFINKMLSQFEGETKNLDWSIAESRGLTRNDVVIIASLIEKEAKIASERELVSAVIYNRLKKNKRLEICSTVQYVLPKWKKNLSYDDLKIDSPYNTYINLGLPPGPISNPGIASIKAALNPANVNYLYYVLTGNDGTHTFTENYDDFLKAKKKSSKIRN